ncbi:MAG: 50S ribosomal protein L11 methyltransferase [Syntrophobacteraceae bacterium]
MRIKLPSGLVIRCSPLFPWEKRACDLRIECGSAFHPRHVTSKLCLELLDTDLPALDCSLFLDVGCGSGILALAALRLGAASTVGVDIDPRAIHTSRNNALMNGLMDRAHWIMGTSAAVKGQFDCVAANLPYPILVSILPELALAVRPRGILVVSGFHDVDEEPIRSILMRSGFVVTRSIRGDFSFPELPPPYGQTWGAMTGRKIAEAS